jgi:hypothetical protein
VGRVERLLPESVPVRHRIVLSDERTERDQFQGEVSHTILLGQRFAVITHTQTYTVVTNNTQGTVSGSLQEVGSSEIVLDQTIPANSTNLLYTISLIAANLQSFIMLSDSDLTVKTNSSSAPANTINLKAGKPLVWDISNGYYPNPFTVNVTAFYSTNGTVATNFKCRFLTN